MPDIKFYIQRYVRNEQGRAWVKDGKERSIEEDFGFCRYKSLSNMNAYGKLKSVYTETYVDSDSVRVWFGDSSTREQTSHELKLYFFGSSPDKPITASVSEQIIAAENGWHDFFSFIDNHFLVWHDTLRQRKLLFFVSDAPTIASDIVKGTPYLQCTIKLTNVFGRTFSLDDTTIEDWLASGGKEAEL